MNDNPITIDPPLFLASTTTGCWRCHAAMPAVVLVAPKVSASGGAPCILSEVRELPRSVLAFIQSRFPTFQRRFSKTVGYAYFANTCRRCRVIYGDFYLNEEPGAPFFPETASEARAICLEEIPATGPITVRASLGRGTAELILSGSRRVPSRAAAGDGRHGGIR